MSVTTVQDRTPNFREDGRLYLVRCFACNPFNGRENYALAVASGVCAWCGWRDNGSVDVYEDELDRERQLEREGWADFEPYEPENEL